MAILWKGSKPSSGTVKLGAEVQIPMPDFPKSNW